MTTTVSMGIPGVGEIRPGTHICALYSGPAERDSLLFPFLREGIRKGDTCLCLIDDAEPGRFVTGSSGSRTAGGRGTSSSSTSTERLRSTFNPAGSRSST